METEKIREAILEKAQNEAQEILREAESNAQDIIEKAKRKNEERREEERKRIIADARRESSKITAQASLKAQQIVLKEKDSIIKELLDDVRKRLEKDKPAPEEMMKLISEIVDAFESDEEIRLYVAKRDLTDTEALVEKDATLKGRISEIVEGTQSVGGVVAESQDGKISMDNSFEMRLSMLVPKVLPDIGRKLFGAESK